MDKNRISKFVEVQVEIDGMQKAIIKKIEFT